jgi:hypothetical protein
VSPKLTEVSSDVHSVGCGPVGLGVVGLGLGCFQRFGGTIQPVITYVSQSSVFLVLFLVFSHLDMKQKPRNYKGRTVSQECILIRCPDGAHTQSNLGGKR